MFFKSLWFLVVFGKMKNLPWFLGCKNFLQIRIEIDPSLLWIRSTTKGSAYRVRLIISYDFLELSTNLSLIYPFWYTLGHCESLEPWMCTGEVIRRLMCNCFYYTKIWVVGFLEFYLWCVGCDGFYLGITIVTSSVMVNCIIKQQDFS